jgi:hypothetical protein|tara:strand:+ start:263 stop:577 length:315 start_codon:yes stop_codon:yes gene_type:complete
MTNKIEEEKIFNNPWKNRDLERVFVGKKTEVKPFEHARRKEEVSEFYWGYGSILDFNKGINAYDIIMDNLGNQINCYEGEFIRLDDEGNILKEIKEIDENANRT